MPERYIRVIAASEVVPGQMKRVRIDGHALLIANVEGRYYVVDDTCTHEDASLSTGALKGRLVKCPLHGSRFDVTTGEALEEPAEQPLRTYAVRLERGDVLVEWPGDGG